MILNSTNNTTQRTSQSSQTSWFNSSLKSFGSRLFSTTSEQSEFSTTSEQSERVSATSNSVPTVHNLSLKDIYEIGVENRTRLTSIQDMLAKPFPTVTKRSGLRRFVAACMLGFVSFISGSIVGVRYSNNIFEQNIQKNVAGDSIVPKSN